MWEDCYSKHVHYWFVLLLLPLGETSSGKQNTSTHSTAESHAVKDPCCHQTKWDWDEEVHHWEPVDCLQGNVEVSSCLISHGSKSQPELPNKDQKSVSMNTPNRTFSIPSNWVLRRLTVLVSPWNCDVKAGNKISNLQCLQLLGPEHPLHFTASSPVP